MNLIRKILAGDDLRTTRFHTQDSAFMGWTALPGVVPSVFTWAWQRVTGKCSLYPWWVWKGIAFVENDLLASDRVLEVGSGISTLWLAQRCRWVWSIEESSSWRTIVRERATRLQLDNISILLGESSAMFTKMLTERNYDVVIIDGSQKRSEIFAELMRLGDSDSPRLIVFDDTDRSENKATNSNGNVKYVERIFRGFKPQTVHACETTVLKIP